MPSTEKWEEQGASRAPRAKQKGRPALPALLLALAATETKNAKRATKCFDRIKRALEDPLESLFGEPHVVQI